MRAITIITLCLLVYATGFSQVEQQRSRKQKQEISDPQVPVRNENFTEPSPNGRVDWTEQYIEAKGESVIDTIRFKNPAQARAMATRGAVVVAQRNLLEIINGVRVTGETKVEDMITTSDYVFSRVDGVIKGAEMVGEPVVQYGIVEVTLRAPLYAQNGLAPAVYPGLKKEEVTRGEGFASKSTGEVTWEHTFTDEGEFEEELQQYIFELAGEEFDPSLFPLVVDEDGNILLDMSKLYDPQLGKFPKILQTTKELLKESGLNKAVEVIEVVEAFDGKLVVDKKAKKKFNWDKIGKTIGKIGKILLMLI